MKCSLDISNVLEVISSLYHSIVFLYFFVLIAEEAFLPLLVILCNSAFRWVYLSFSPLPLASLLFSAMCKASLDNYFAFVHFFFLGMVLITTSCKMSRILVHSSSGLPTIKSNAGLFPCFYLVSQLSQNHLWKTVLYFLLNFYVSLWEINSLPPCGTVSGLCFVLLVYQSHWFIPCHKHHWIIVIL